VRIGDCDIFAIRFARRFGNLSVVQNLATPQKTADASAMSEKHFSAPLVLSVLFLVALWFVLCRQLSGEWSVNQQYNFGWFVPFFAIYLFWLRWQDRPQLQIPNSEGEIRKRQRVAALLAIPALLLLQPARLFEIANPEWRLLDWVHATAVVTLTLLFIWSAGGGPWLRHFAFPVAFIFVAVPWPTVVEVPIIQGLMRVVASVAAETAMLLGIPAQVEGNLIRVANGLVGVNEACSGIRSLQTSLMIGLLFGELKRLSVLRRITLIGGAILIALLANLVRAVFLVVVAGTKDLSEVSRWHDIAGYTIIVLVFVGTMGIAYLLGESGTRHRRSEVGGNWQLAMSFPGLYLATTLCWLLLVEIATEAWYRAHETNLVSPARWSVHWPEQARNFRKLKIDPEIRSVLRFDEGEAAAWTITSRPDAETSLPEEAAPSATRAHASGENIMPCFLYVFRWKPGRNSALLANLHRPDVCLPASGWTQIADDGVRNYSLSGQIEMPFRHFEFQRRFQDSAPQTAHAFYCLSEDRAAARAALPRGADLPSMSGSPSEWTRGERLGAVLEGRRHLGQQVIEAIFVSSESFSATDAESHLRDLVQDVVVVAGRGD